MTYGPNPARSFSFCKKCFIGTQTSHLFTYDFMATFRCKITEVFATSFMNHKAKILFIFLCRESLPISYDIKI